MTKQPNPEWGSMTQERAIEIFSYVTVMGEAFTPDGNVSANFSFGTVEDVCEAIYLAVQVLKAE